MSKGTSIVGMLVALSFGLFLGNWIGQRTARDAAGPPALAAKAPLAGERLRVPIGPGPLLGPDSAKVTIVEFSDYQCPFCARSVETLKKVLATYGRDVRLQVRHLLIPHHDKSPLAVQAALAAAAQGRFWPMHERLLLDQQHLERADLERVAQDLGLDLARFRAALDGQAGKSTLDADLRLARDLAVPGTPSFYVNGRFFGGGSFAEWKQLVDQEIAAADRMIREGTPADRLYARLQAQAQPRPTAARPAGSPGTGPAAPAASAQRYRIPVGASPVRGAATPRATPKVTIVEFSDFQCPVCGRAEPLLDEILKTYADRGVRLVWKDMPLAMHPNAQPAAEAARAAGAQGRFWPMHDLLIRNQTRLDRAALEGYATELGLDLARFRAALDAHLPAADIQKDAALASTFGVRGTPTFFVNGRSFLGIPARETLVQTIEEEIRRADALLAQKVAPARLYEELTKGGLDRMPPPPGMPDPALTYRAEVGHSPVRGAPGAKVTIVLWSDFQCPFCARIEPILAEALAAYPEDLRIVWKNQPLVSRHPDAMPAAEAALAAGEQGRFWEMHDLLFQNQGKLDGASLSEYARRLGLDEARFQKALDEHRFRQDIEADMAAGARIGARATPTLYLNGRPILGGLPIEALRARIEEARKAATALLRQGTPRSRLYERILSGARDAVDPAPPPPAPPAATPVKADVPPGAPRARRG